MYLTLLETAGNQGYIFASNRLVENVGGSGLIVELGQRGEEFAKYRGDTLKRLIATSGKIQTLSADRDPASDMVREITGWALENAPGLDVYGAIVELNRDDPGSLRKASREVAERYVRNRSMLPTAESRFLRLPVMAECRTSG